MVAASEPRWKHRHCGERLGRYVLGSAIGAGGAASVYLARLDGPHGFERVLAIKVVHEHLLEDRGFVDTFRDEANLAVLLSHPNIVHTYELGCEGERIFIAMEYLRGKPLSLVYERAFAENTPLDYQLIAWIGARCADALHYAHELRGDDGRPLKIVHRDISPDNLVITYEGDVKVIDFGIARAERRLGKTALGTVKGKRRYMAPEYALGGGFDHTLDLFALGASLYEAALGRSAFGSDDDVATLERLFWGDLIDPLQVRHDFPPELARVLRKAMSPEREQRHATGEEMARELDKLAGLTASEARGRLSKTMRALFASEMTLEAAIVGEMRSAKTADPPDQTTSLQHSLSSRLAPRSSSPVAAPPSSRSRMLPAFVAAGGALAIAFLLIRYGAPHWTTPATNPARIDQGTERAVTDEAPPPSASVTVHILVQPSTASAEIMVDGQRVSARPPVLELHRSDAPVPVEVVADGYYASRSEVIPNRDRSVVVSLAELPGQSRPTETKPPSDADTRRSAPSISLRTGSRPNSASPMGIAEASPAPLPTAGTTASVSRVVGQAQPSSPPGGDTATRGDPPPQGRTQAAPAPAPHGVIRNNPFSDPIP